MYLVRFSKNRSLKLVNLAEYSEDDESDEKNPLLQPQEETGTKGGCYLYSTIFIVLLYN